MASHFQPHCISHSRDAKANAQNTPIYENAQKFDKNNNE